MHYCDMTQSHVLCRALRRKKKGQGVKAQGKSTGFPLTEPQVPVHMPRKTELKVKNRGESIHLDKTQVLNQFFFPQPHDIAQ